MITYVSRPAILSEISHRRHAVIEASAGTGKTYTIEHLVIDLIVRQRVPITEILVLTFTERAAGELRRRIRSKIESILLQQGGSPDLAGKRDQDSWLIDDVVRQNLSRALFSFDGASIGTIHGFFGRVMAEHAFTSGRLFKGELKDGQALFSRAFRTALRCSLARQPGRPAELLGLWLEQNQGGVDRLEKLLWECHASHRQIKPEFSWEALQHEVDRNQLFATDLASEGDRFKKALKAAKINGNTINAVMRRITTLSGLVNHARPDWRVVLDDRFQDAVHTVAKSLQSCHVAGNEAGQIIAAIQRLDEVLICKDAALVQIGLPIVREFLEGHKAATGEFDHDDQIQGVASAVEGCFGQELIRTMQARYRFALLDEFQDTDKLQWLFFERVFLESAGQHALYLIGDPKQAIYGFRGADVHTYLKARDRVEQEGSPLIPLMENFRSTRRPDRCLQFCARPLGLPDILGWRDSL